MSYLCRDAEAIIIPNKKDKKENKEGEKEGEKQQGEQKKEDTGQQGENRKDEQSGEKNEGEQKTGQEEGAEEDEGTPQDNRKMTPEEAKMLLDTVGEEGSMEDLKKQGSGHYRGVLKDW